MPKLYVDNDRYDAPPGDPLVEAVHSQVMDLVRRRLAESGDDWNAFVFGTSNHLITTADFASIEKKILEAGHRFDWSAMVSIKERPEIHKPSAPGGGDLATFSFEHPDAVVAVADASGREQRGVGDNVVRGAANAVGIARHVRSGDQVLALMRDGVPDGTIAIIDDSGGTLTAPILEHFAGVICAGGTVRSHLGILTREYGIPCLMNARISGIRDGDRIELEITAPAKTAEAYQRGEEMTARIWRLTR
jgi:phosphohistidine swiveling domain-containing protein